MKIDLWSNRNSRHWLPAGMLSRPDLCLFQELPGRSAEDSIAGTFFILGRARVVRDGSHGQPWL